MSRHLPGWATGVVVVALVVVACSSQRGQTQAQKTAEFTLVAGKTGANSTLNFNGYAKGALTITVPVGWRVVIHYQNNTPLRHSFGVIRYTGTQPEKAIPPVFKGASTKDVTDGIGPGQAETITFVAEKAGKYEFMCGVLGHALAGMWDYLVVSSTVKSPSAQPAKGAALTVRQP